MISSYVAHDCKIGNNVVIANNVPLGGHVVMKIFCYYRRKFNSATIHTNR